MWVGTWTDREPALRPTPGSRLARRHRDPQHLPGSDRARPKTVDGLDVDDEIANVVTRTGVVRRNVPERVARPNRMADVFDAGHRDGRGVCPGDDCGGGEGGRGPGGPGGGEKHPKSRPAGGRQS